MGTTKRSGARAPMRWDQSQLAALAIAVLGAVLVFIFAPPDIVHRLLDLLGELPASVYAGIALTVLGVGASPFLDRLVRRDEPAPVPLERVRRDADPPPPADRAGHASLAALLAVGTIALAAALAMLGCSPSAIRVHATSATIATTALAGVRPILLEAADAAIARCEAGPLEERAACLDEAERTHQRVGVVFDSAVLATGVYRDGIETAAIAGGDDPAVNAALDRGLAAVRARWGELLELVRVLDPDAAARLGGVP
jgi:hypothetical protein